MTPPILSVKGEGQANISLVSSSASIDSISWNNSGLKERNYLGLSDCSSVDSSAVPSLSDNNDKNLILKATELKLCLPGSLSPKRNPEPSLLGSTKLDEKIVLPLLPSKGGVCSSSLKTVASGNKRGFSDTVDGFSEVKGSSFTEGNWVFSAAVCESEAKPTVGQGKFAGSGATNVVLSSISSQNQPTIMKEVSQKASHEQNHSTIGSNHSTKNGPNNNSGIPAAKAQVVGWPPIRSFRKNTVAAPSKDNEEVDGKPGPGSLYVKVSMDGAPYLRKVDLRTYSTYQELSSALKKMFGYFTTGQCGSQGTLGREMLGEIKSRDLLHGSEFFLTYEDKDGDWMLVGDVPWEMFIESCKRLKIVKGSDAIGLAPRTTEKSKNWN